VFDRLASKKIGVTELNFPKKVFKLEVFYYTNKAAVQKCRDFFGFKNM
jgi:hypothetical protein